MIGPVIDAASVKFSARSSPDGRRAIIRLSFVTMTIIAWKGMVVESVTM